VKKRILSELLDVPIDVLGLGDKIRSAPISATGILANQSEIHRTRTGSIGFGEKSEKGQCEVDKTSESVPELG
jgi:hypothetical protein